MAGAPRSVKNRNGGRCPVASRLAAASQLQRHRPIVSTTPDFQISTMLFSPHTLPSLIHTESIDRSEASGASGRTSAIGICLDSSVIEEAR
ncbi:MAG: hypothetical protein ACRDF7_11335 [Candidatus Limnocylindrales bacterium]